MSRILLALCLVFGLMPAAWAGIDAREFNTPDQEQRYRSLIEELRCPKCQNQNLAGSDAPIAKDLKDKTYLMIIEGKTDDEVRQYLKERYGDFISYKPPFRVETFLLWFGPALLMLLGALVVVLRIRNRAGSGEMQSLSAAEQERLKRLLAGNDSGEQH